MSNKNNNPILMLIGGLIILISLIFIPTAYGNVTSELYPYQTEHILYWIWGIFLFAVEIEGEIEEFIIFPYFIITFFLDPLTTLLNLLCTIVILIFGIKILTISNKLRKNNKDFDIKVHKTIKWSLIIIISIIIWAIYMSFTKVIGGIPISIFSISDEGGLPFWLFFKPIGMIGILIGAVLSLYGGFKGKSK